MVSKVIIIFGTLYGFKGQPCGSRSTMDYTYAILLTLPNIMSIS